MPTHFKVGDKVQWRASQGVVQGTVKKLLTSPMDIRGHHVDASLNSPQYLVESHQTGAQAAHKPESLTKIR